MPPARIAIAEAPVEASISGTATTPASSADEAPTMMRANPRTFCMCSSNSGVAVVLNSLRLFRLRAPLVFHLRVLVLPSSLSPSTAHSNLHTLKADGKRASAHAETMSRMLHQRKCGGDPLRGLRPPLCYSPGAVRSENLHGRAGDVRDCDRGRRVPAFIYRLITCRERSGTAVLRAGRVRCAEDQNGSAPISARAPRSPPGFPAVYERPTSRPCKRPYLTAVPRSESDCGSRRPRTAPYRRLSPRAPYNGPAYGPARAQSSSSHSPHNARQPFV